MEIKYISKNLFFSCLQCAQCTSICPISKLNQNFNPRKIVLKYLSETLDLIDIEIAWLCVDCKLCTEVCPKKIPIDEIMANLKLKLYNKQVGSGFKHTKLFIENIKKYGILNEKKLVFKLLNYDFIKDLPIYIKVYFKKKLYWR
ncbi:MAG: (Fe-S)-binding protein [Candidatus Nanopusillus acidilobi]|jgi:heterodisulfide reductase subunit C